MVQCQPLSRRGGRGPGCRLESAVKWLHHPQPPPPCHPLLPPRLRLQDTAGKPIQCKAAIAWESNKPLEVGQALLGPRCQPQNAPLPHAVLAGWLAGTASWRQPLDEATRRHVCFRPACRASAELGSALRGSRLG